MLKSAGPEVNTRAVFTAAVHFETWLLFRNKQNKNITNNSNYIVYRIYKHVEHMS